MVQFLRHFKYLALVFALLYSGWACAFSATSAEARPGTGSGPYIRVYVDSTVNFCGGDFVVTINGTSTRPSCNQYGGNFVVFQLSSSLSLVSTDTITVQSDMASGSQGVIYASNMSSINLNPALSVSTVNLPSPLQAQASLTLLASPSSLVFGSSASSTLSTTGGSGTGAVTYAVTSGSCGLAGQMLSVGFAMAGSTCTVTATKDADSTYASTTATLNVSVVALTAQSTLTALASPTSITAGAGSSALSTSGGSGTGAVTYAVTSGACTVSGSTLSAGSAAGGSTCTVTATKAADSTYNSTTATVNVSVVALTAQSTLTAFASPSSITVGTGSSTLSTSGGSGTGAISYAVTAGACTLSGNTLSAGSAAGGSTCTVTATKAADSTYASTTATVNVSVVTLSLQSGLTVSASPTSIVVGTGTSTLSNSGGAGTGAVTYAVTSGACTVSGNTLSAGSAAAGSTCTVTATKAADSTYASTTTTVNVSVVALSAQATLTASASPTSIMVSTGTSSLSTSGGSGTGAVTYAVTSGACTVSGSTLSAGSAAGGSTCTVTATKAADSTYASTTATVNVSVLALSAQATLTALASPTSIVVGTGTSTLSTSGGSGTGAVTYAVTSGSCTVSGSTLSAGTAAVGATCTVTVTKAADSTYAPTTATVNVSISSRRSIDAAVDASVKGALAAQVSAASRFTETQMRNVTEHLNQLGLTFNVRANRLGVGLNSPLLRPTMAQSQPAWAIAVNGQGQNMVDSPSSASPVETVLAQNGKDATPIAAQKGSVASELNDAIFGQMGLSIWASGDVVHGRMGVNSSTNKFHTDGLTLGFDHLLNDKTIVGVALGYGTDNTKVDDFNSRVRGSQWAVTAYGVYKPQEGVLLDALLGRGQSSFDNTRYSVASNSLLSSTRKGSSTVLAVGASAPFTLQAVNLKPYLRVSHTDLNMGAYSEAGDVNALSLGKAHWVTQSAFAGVMASYDIADATGGKWTPNAKLELRRNSSGSMLQSISYADTPSESTTLLTTASPRDQQTMALGVQYTHKQGGQLSVGWSSTRGTGDFRANGYKLQVRLPF
jgi:uncharacterized protein with beta-barrel porin domain